MTTSAAPLHIGIVGCSAEGAALCYRTICSEAADVLGAYAHPEVSMHTHSLARYVQCLDAGDWDGVAALMLDSARKLAAAGAHFAICPDNTIHQAFASVAQHSPIPWLHIAEVVAGEAARRGFTRVGVLGTRWLVDSAVYPQQLAARGIACVKPDEPARAAMGRIIMDELVHGVFDPASVAVFQSAVLRFQEQGCQAAVLGCTEIPLILHDGNAALPTLDSTRLLARATIRRAVVANSFLPMHIETDDLSRPAIHALLQEHLQRMHALSPPESVHALDLDRLRAPGITFWSAWEGETLLGCGALKQLDAGHGEVKSMRTPAARRRTGAGRALLAHIVAEARARGYRRLSLETGSGPAFVPAQTLYASAGFQPCGPFADYRPDPFSVFMTLELRDAPA